MDDLVHVVWDSHTGRVSVLGRDRARVLDHDRIPLPSADEVSLEGNARLVDSFQKAGLDLTSGTSAANLAAGKTATASFTSTTPAAQVTDPANAVDGYTISGLPVVLRQLRRHQPDLG